MIRANHPAIKLTAYATVALICIVLGIWDWRAALIICTVAFAVDGLTLNVLRGSGVVKSDSRWLVYGVQLAAIATGRSFAALLGF